MASSTALTTMSGLIPFSRLSASITLYSSLAIRHLPPNLDNQNHALSRKPLKLGHEVGLLHVGQLDIDFRTVLDCFVLLAFLAARQFEVDAATAQPLHPTFKMPAAVDRVPRHQLHQTAAEAFELGRLRQLAVQTGRGHLQGVRPTWHRVFDVEDRPHFPAEVRAVVVGHSTRLVNVNPQHPGSTAAAELHLDHFQAAGARHPLGNLLNLVQSRHLLPPSGPQRPSATRPTGSQNRLDSPTASGLKVGIIKWALAHRCASPSMPGFPPRSRRWPKPLSRSSTFLNIRRKSSNFNARTEAGAGWRSPPMVSSPIATVRRSGRRLPNPQAVSTMRNYLPRTQNHDSFPRS